jgi:hypothetical protein
MGTRSKLPRAADAQALQAVSKPSNGLAIADDDVTDLVSD